MDVTLVLWMLMLTGAGLLSPTCQAWKSSQNESIVLQKAIYDPRYDPSHHWALLHSYVEEYKLPCGLTDRLNSSCYMTWNVNYVDVCYANSTSYGCDESFAGMYEVVYKNEDAAILNLTMTRSGLSWGSESHDCNVHCLGSHTPIGSSGAVVIVMEKTICQSTTIMIGEDANVTCVVQYDVKRPYMTFSLCIKDEDGDLERCETRYSDKPQWTLTTDATAKNLTVGHHQLLCFMRFPKNTYPICQIPVHVSPVIGNEMRMQDRHPHEGESIEVECVITLGEETSGGYYEWYLNEDKMRESHKIHITQLNHDLKYRSLLKIRNIKARYSGKLACKFFTPGFGYAAEMEDSLFVLARPHIEMSTYSLTLMEGENLNVSCISGVEKTGHPNDTQPATITWYRNGTLIDNITFPEETINEYCSENGSSCLSHLYKSNPKDPYTTYNCEAQNSAGRSQMETVHIFVLRKGSLACERDVAEDIIWPETEAGFTVNMPCPGLSTGICSRKCQGDGVWEDVNTDYCIDERINDLMDEIQDMEDGIGANTNKTERVACDLDDIITNKTTSDEVIKPGNLNDSVEALNRLALLHGTINEPPNTEEVQSVTNAASMLIEKENHESWKKLLTENTFRAVSIMSTLDTYAESLTKNSDCTVQDMGSSFYTSNIVLRSDKWSAQNGSVKYPRRHMEESWIDDTQDFITIDNETLAQISEGMDCQILALTSIYYKTLDEILPNKTYTSLSKGSGNVVGSKILALGVVNSTSGRKLRNPIQLYFQHNLAIQNEIQRSVCSYWDFHAGSSGSWSSEGCSMIHADKNGTTCECDHMTNFAVLVSNHIPGGAIHQVLSILSMVGCSLSVICMVITVAVYAVLWKPLEKALRGSTSRSITVVSLCLVLILANILFLTGVETTTPKILCITIAAVLHYLFLAAFGIMLASGIQLYLKVTSLAHGMSPESWKQTLGFLLGALVLPVVIVGVTLAVVEPEHYINNDLCWLAIDKGVIFSFIGPIVLVVIVNTVITVIVLCKTIRSKTSQLRGNSKAFTQMEIAKSTLRSIAVLTPIMGTTWIIGVLAFDEKTVVFQFIFVILNSTQGIFIFIFYCLLDGSVKKAREEKASKRTSSQRSDATTMELSLGSDNASFTGSNQMMNGHSSSKRQARSNPRH